ncbi:unnamed protein product, partial [Vitis vinifera]
MKKMRFLLEVLVPALLTGMLASMAEGRTHSYDFVLKETNFTRLCSTKSMTTVNDSFPGPVIRRVQKATWCMSTFTIKTILVSLSIGTDRYFSFSYTL